MVITWTVENEEYMVTGENLNEALRAAELLEEERMQVLL